MSEDKINPSHYQAPGGYQAIDIIEYFNLNFARGNAVKYLLRAGNKAENGYEAIDKEIALSNGELNPKILSHLYLW